MSSYISDLTAFIEQSPSCFHVIANLSNRLREQGFIELSEKEAWKLKKGYSYFVTRNSSSLIGFHVPECGISSYHAVASHSDYPCFKIKENPEIKVDQQYIKLNVERYGGMLMGPWFDRPLSIAGRVYLDARTGIEERLVHFDKDLVLIPSLAIHMNREANDGYKYNAQKDMLPLFGDVSSSKDLMQLLSDTLRVSAEQILGHDLYLYNRQRASVWGAGGEYFSAPHLDDLECAYGSFLGFLNGKKETHTALYCVFDNEEVGSGTRQGAASTFLSDTLTRIGLAFGQTQEENMIQLASSFMLSADNAHAVHPNHPDKSDPVNRPYLNKGVVLKFSGNQKYCTDAASAAYVRKLCQDHGIPLQIFTNRSDIPGGSTLGNIASTRVPMASADIGLPQLAMHSPYETAGVSDFDAFVKLTELFYS